MNKKTDKKIILDFKPFDKEERKLAESVERGEWASISNKQKRLQTHIDDAKYTITKSKSINIRLTPGDLMGIKLRALEEGIPYQTLISSIIHKYSKGKLKNL